MHRIRIYLGSECLLFSACIDPFYPNLGSQTTANIDEQITDQEGYQTVSVSMSFTIKDTDNKPLSNCKVKITDNKGNVFNLVEFGKGNYTGWVEKQYLIPENSYQVDVITSTGIEITSDFNQMPECPEIDSICYIRENIATTNPSNPRQGIQFYVDLDGGNTNSHYYRGNITETWEYHAVYPKTWVWTGRKMIQYYPPDYSLFCCLTTKSVPTIYTLSTVDLAQNSYHSYEPAYLYEIQGPGKGKSVVENYCVECNYFGGNTVKPDY